jgi:hypothetical protein
MTAEVLDKFAQLITTALGLVAALAWNAAIQALFTKLFGEAGAALVGQFAYALLITLVVIFATIAVGRAAERAKRAEERLKEEQGRGAAGAPEGIRSGRAYRAPSRATTRVRYRASSRQRCKGRVQAPFTGVS